MQSSNTYRGSPLPPMPTDNYKRHGMMRTSTNSLTECMWPMAIYYDDLDHEDVGDVDLDNDNEDGDDENGVTSP